ncbi:MAG TPA: helix-turn-helix transcriptional regulator [Thermomicrobiales bacterium]|nr:helix-turn-helix transcriptional regulator [Thermomicrobiales bacterium]
MVKKSSRSGEQFAGRLNDLFKRSHPPGREFTNEEVSAGILQRKGVQITANYIGQLRSGRAKNPSLSVIEALADFFGAPPEYFFDTAVQQEVAAEMDLINALRNSSVRNLALRLVQAQDLSPDVLHTVTTLIEQLSERERTPPTKSKRGAGTE